MKATQWTAIGLIEDTLQTITIRSRRHTTISIIIIEWIALDRHLIDHFILMLPCMALQVLTAVMHRHLLITGKKRSGSA